MTDKDAATIQTGEPADRSEAVVRPPLLVLAALLVGFGLDFVWPMSLFGASLSAVSRWLIGGGIFAAALALAAWAMVCFSRAGTNIPTTLPTTAIVGAGPYGYSRNPIYVGMLGLILAVAIAADSVWLLLMLPIVALVLNYGVIAREERYLARKFGAPYLDYKAQVRRWL